MLGSLVPSPSLFQFVFAMTHRGGRATKNEKGLVLSHEGNMMGGRGGVVTNMYTKSEESRFLTRQA